MQILWYTIHGYLQGQKPSNLDKKEVNTMLYTQLQQKVCTQTINIPCVGTIVYILLEDTLPNGLRYYSIAVKLTKINHQQEESTVQNVTTDRQLALQLFWQLCRGTVTPCTLTEVLAELLP